MQNPKQPALTGAIVFNIILHGTNSRFILHANNEPRQKSPSCSPKNVISLRVFIDKATVTINAGKIF